MSINLYNSTLHNGLFDALGKSFKCQSDINLSRGNTIPGDIQSLLAAFDLQPFTPSVESAVQPVFGAIASYQSGASSTMSTLATYAANLAIAIAANDRTQPDASLKTALGYIISQMTTQGQAVKRSTVSVSITAGASNAGDGVILTSTKRGDGLVQENAIGEVLTGTAQSSSLASSISFAGGQAASSILGQDWPLGSGAGFSLSAVDANTGSGSLLTNGGMETQVNNPNVPDNWILSVGTPGTTCGMTITGVLSLTVAGTPGSGDYIILWTDRYGKVQATAPLAYNASGATVQSALRLLSGLSQVTVVTTGTTPNFTHTVTMTGVPGDPNLFSIISYLNTGTVTPAVVTHGTVQVLAGNSAFYFVSNGSELTAYQQQLTTLQPSTAYAISLWACADIVPGAGALTVDLVDGIGGMVIADAQSVANSITFNASSLTTGFQHLSQLQTGECVFRTPAILPSLIYLRIRISTAVTNSRKVFWDNVGMNALTQVYAGGPLMSAFAGAKPFSTADTWTITVANDRLGVLREWCNRNFNMAALGLLMPTSASPTIPDSVVVPANVTNGLDFSLAGNSQYAAVVI